MKQKLKSSCGATVILALLFFLICAMVGSVILAAASVNVNRVKEQREQEQAYLTLSSAAQLVADSLDSVTLTGTREDEDPDGDGVYTKSDWDYELDPSDTTTMAGTLASYFNEVVFEPDNVVLFTIIASPDGGDDLDAVDAVIHIGAAIEEGSSISSTADYDVTITLTLDSSDYTTSIQLSYLGAALSTGETGNYAYITWTLNDVSEVMESEEAT